MSDRDRRSGRWPVLHDVENFYRATSQEVPISESCCSSPAVRHGNIPAFSVVAPLRQRDHHHRWPWTARLRPADRKAGRLAHGESRRSRGLPDRCPQPGPCRRAQPAGLRSHPAPDDVRKRDRRLGRLGRRRCLLIPRLAPGKRAGFHIVLHVDANAPSGTETNEVDETPEQPPGAPSVPGAPPAPGAPAAPTAPRKWCDRTCRARSSRSARQQGEGQSQGRGKAGPSSPRSSADRCRIASVARDRLRRPDGRRDRASQAGPRGGRVE